jgi:Putative phage metallopeptidase
MSKKFMAAPDADRIAAELLSTVHADIAEFPVRCIFQEEADKKLNHVVLANVRKLSGLNAFLAGSVAIEGLQDSLDLDLAITFQEPRELILIMVAHGRWQSLTDAQRVALIDHELCHVVCVTNEDGETHPKIIGHDVEEFHAIIHRHGDWKGEVAGFQPPVKLRKAAGGAG